MDASPVTWTEKPPQPDVADCLVDPNGNIYPDPFGLSFGGAFNGIPQNVIINMVIFAGLVAIFVALRKRAWGSSRIPLVGRFKNEWSSIFYGNRTGGIKAPATDHKAVSPDSTDTTEIVKLDSPDGLPQDQLSFRSWIRNTFMSNDRYLLERSGPAALEYLRFQRHVIIFTTVLSVISIAIILPINYKGMEMAKLNSTFTSTTISNLSDQDTSLWVHVAFTLILFPMALLVMYSYGLQFGLIKVAPVKLPKTLMIYGLKSRITTEEKIRQHFDEVYPGIEISQINLTLDVTKLNSLDQQLCSVNDALFYYQSALGGDQIDPPIVRDFICGYCLTPCVHGTDAVEFYEGKKLDLEKKIHTEVQSWKKTNPVFFLTLASVDMVARIHQDYHIGSVTKKKPTSSVSQEIGADKWIARLAPSASFVSWENLSSNGAVWWAKALLINLLLFFVILFVSSPAVVLNSLSLNKDGNRTQVLADSVFIKSLPFVSQFVPTILLLSVMGLMPNIIYYAVQLIGYHTRSKEMRAEMKLLFASLLLGILFLPTLALTSWSAIYELFFKAQNVVKAFRWNCVFLPDNGALFVNLMVTIAFVGAGTRLLRFGQLFVFLCRFFCCARSDAERYILTRTKQQFPFHQYYPDFLLTFTIVAVYCFICPMVTPFGVLALTAKYLVDRYNLSYVYGPSGAPNSVHASAVNCFLVGILMQNFLMIFFFVLKQGDNALSAMSSLLVGSLVINGIIYIMISWFGLLKKASLYDEFNMDDIDTPVVSPVGSPVYKSKSNLYIPPVLQRYEAGYMSSESPSNVAPSRSFHESQA
ncbi:Calcium permeable stress-gated cation channel 1 [Hypsibius exemplaris]|uniref:Calcium permeable stress-gated cation channel 1 n=1 Tax=Hypsibius exemplaris TaxID=2072580 RepID=A0A1W0WFE3_HYPEX|nr:Calcium permeable stress-gated cation channel 1 [Hypsibius exemplaris]